MPSHVVGIESKIGDLSSENGTEYFPPSHWATSNSHQTSSNRNFLRNSNGQRRNGNNNDNHRDGAKAIPTNSFINRHGKYLIFQVPIFNGLIYYYLLLLNVIIYYFVMPKRS